MATGVDGDGDRSSGLTLVADGGHISHTPNLNLNPPPPPPADGSILFQGKVLTVSDAQNCVDKFKETLTPQDYDQFIDILKEYIDRRIDVSAVKEKVIKLCQPHQQLLLLFNSFLPQREKIIFPQAADDQPPPYQVKNTRLYDALVQFIGNVKMKLQDDEHLYNCFIRILKWYRLGHRTVSEARQVITYLFNDHKDLLMEFNSISSLAHSENATIASGSKPPRHDEKEKSSEKVNNLPVKKRITPTPLEQTVMKGFPQDMHEQVFALNVKVKEHLYQIDDYQNYLKCIKYYHSQNISRSELSALVKDLLGARPDLMEAFNKVMHRVTKTDTAKEDEALDEKGRSKREILLTPGTKRSLSSNKDKNKAKPVPEPNRTPTCQLIPCDFIIPDASKKKEKDKQTLKDYCVSNKNCVKTSMRRTYVYIYE